MVLHYTRDDVQYHYNISVTSVILCSVFIWYNDPMESLKYPVCKHVI